MNRRHFLSSLATAVAGFTILPPATTYQRVWRVERPLAQHELIPFVALSGSYWVHYANRHGVYAMLEECGRINKLDPAPLDMKEMFDLIYKVKTDRERQCQFVRSFFFDAPIVNA